MSVSHTNSWLEAQEAGQQRTFVRALAISFALHLAVAAFLLVAPKPDPMLVPSVISVRMVSLPDSMPAPTRAKAEPAKAPAPVPLPAKPKPLPVAKKVILPKRATLSKKPKPKPKPMTDEEILASFRDELGEEAPPEAPPALQEVALSETAEPGAADSSSGVEADPSIVAWRLATQRHLRKNWRSPPEFMNRSLATDVIVTLTGSGEILGYEITGPSTDPYWDDVVSRVWVGASPLPPPPRAGDWTFRFTPEEGY